MDLPERKPMRLRDYDYSSPGAYFITICTRWKECVLSRILVGEGLAPPAVALTAIGRIVEEQVRLLPGRFPSLSVDRYVIMPNHIHLVLTLSGDSAGGASPSPTITNMVGALKSQTSRLSGMAPLWQRSYYDHVIRGERDYSETWAYMDGNPGRWAEDELFAQ